MMGEWRERRGVARDKDRGIIQGSEDGPPEAVLVSLEFSLLRGVGGGGCPQGL